MSCNSCWSWCKSSPTPSPPPEPRNTLQYVESKSVIRPTPPTTPVSNTSGHKRVLSTMFIKDGKVVISYHDMTEDEANKKFGKSADKASVISSVRFSDLSSSSPTPLT